MSCRLRRGWGVFTLAFMACGAQEAPTPESAQTALATGEYATAIRLYRELAATEPDSAALGLTQALLATGEYDDALQSAPSTFWRGEALLRLGQLDEARARFDSAAAELGPKRNMAELRLGQLELRTGQHAAALARFDGFIDVYNGAESLSVDDLTAVGLAVYALSVTNSDLVHDARRALDEAVTRASGNPEPTLHLGEIFLDKYQSGDARAEFAKVLDVNPKHPDALVGMARAMAFDGEPGSADLLDQALDVNRHHVGALLARTRARLAAEDRDGARATAQAALDVDPSSLEARSLAAIADLLDGDPPAFERQADAVLASNPLYAPLFAEAAEMASRQRWYARAAELALRGSQVDSLHARSFGELGLNHLRVGAIDEGRANLERAFALDPFNVWYFNTLELVDTFERYQHVSTTNFELVLEQGEAALLGPYVGDMAERALAGLGERYGALPPLPIRLELYPSHADFSVRTVGLDGMGALGVSFGSVLAMDSPSARAPGEFNWASTLWHEVAHSFHLALSEHNVPRWFTEGLAMWEQRRAQPGWGHSVTPMFLDAYASGRLRPVSELNEGFVRPQFPEEVGLSYLLASLVLEHIEEEYGFEAILAFLEGYRTGSHSNALIESVLGVAPERFDQQFDSYIRARFAEGFASAAAPPASPDDAIDSARVHIIAGGDADNFFTQLRQGIERFESGDAEGARPYLERAAELFPEYGSTNSPWWYLGQIHEQAEELAQAEVAYARLLALSEHHTKGAAALAELRARIGDPAGAADAWGRVLEIDPFAADPHRRRAELFEELGAWDRAAVERHALVALDPVDRAEALYQWARALARDGQRELARTQVLEALDIAPTYDEALELLLELRGGGE